MEGLDLNRSFPQFIRSYELDLSPWEFDVVLLVPVDSYNGATRALDFGVSAPPPVALAADAPVDAGFDEQSEGRRE